MNDKERRIVDKLKALIANTPYEGEKQTAINVLKKYCLEHNISEEELDEPSEKEFQYDIANDSWAYGLFKCVSFHFFDRKGEASQFNEKIRFYEYTDRKYKHLLCVKIICSLADFAELIAEFQQYNSAFKKQLKRFLKKKNDEFQRAFLDKNNLLLPFDFYKRIGEERPEDQVKYFEEAISYEITLSEVKKIDIYKQLEASKSSSK